MPPLPKRTTELLGHRSKAELEAVTKVEIRGGVKIPAANPRWHDIAHDLYAASIQSGQTRWYEPTDWVMLQLACDELTDYLNGRRSGMKLQILLQLLSSLMVTEGDRRRLRMEVDRHQVVDSSDAEAAELYSDLGL